MMTKLEAIKELSKHDHSFLKPERVKQICEPFGLKPITYFAEDCRSQFKGLTLYGINPETDKEFQEGEKAEGQDAHRLACYIADNMKIEYQDCFGIGSQLRSACGAVERYLIENCTTDDGGGIC